MLEHFREHGFALLPDVLTLAEIESGRALFDAHVTARAGTRNLLREPSCRQLAEDLQRRVPLAVFLSGAPHAVQCTAFAKTPQRNWLVSLHQDLMIPVDEECIAIDPALPAWSEKEDVLYTQAPVEVLAALVAVRVHLDACGATEGPLRVVPGSHAHGILDAEAASTMRESCGEIVCTAPLGSALVMRPLLLHASSKATSNRPRRVLHFVFGPEALPLGLRWAR